jgi:hypothetical protein
MTPRRKKLLVLGVIACVFLFFHLYHLERPFSTNGIDEGIHLLQAQMTADGFSLYEELNGDQAPLAILTFSLFKGAVLPSRLLSFLLFAGATGAAGIIAWRIKNRQAGVMTVLLLSLDFTLLRESRLASLDLFSAALLCMAGLLFVVYLERPRWMYAAGGGLLLSLSCLSKLMAAPCALAVTVAAVWYAVRHRRLEHFAVYALAGMVPALALLFLFSPDALLNGVLLRQLHRGADWSTKASVLLFIGPSFVYLLALRRWDLRDRRVAFVVLWLLSLLAFILVQGRTFQHHFAYAAFPAAILAGMVLGGWSLDSRKTVAVVASFVAVNAVLMVSLVGTAPPDLSYEVADHVAAVSDDDAWVLSGNPLVNVLADRNAPPNLTNLARYHYPPTTTSNITYWLEGNRVEVVVLYYHLAEMPGVARYLNRSGRYEKAMVVEGKGQLLFDGVTPRFSTDRYIVYRAVNGTT